MSWAMADPARRIARKARRSIQGWWNAAITACIPVPDHSYPVLRDTFRVEDSGDSKAVVFDSSGDRLVVNSASVTVLGLCNGGRRLGAINSVLAREFDIPPAVVANQVRDLVRRLVRDKRMTLHRRLDPPPFLVLPAATATVIGSEVEAAVRFRMGRFYDHFLPLYHEVAAAHSKGRLTLEFRDGRLVGYGGDQDVDRDRNKQIIEHLTGMDVPRRNFHIIYASSDHGGSDPSVPINAHFRVAGSDATILWPLDGYTDSGSGHFGRNIDELDRPWHRKIDKAVWRGATTGVSINDLTAEQIEVLITRRLEARDPVSGRVLPKGNRLKLVADYHDDREFDIGLASFAQIDEYAQEYFRKKGFMKGSLSRQDLLAYKYLIVVDGNSFATQLPWALHSRSLVLMVPPSWETILQGVTAWEHYVPLAADFSDLREKIEWCRSNDRRCREISRCATELMRRHYDSQQDRMIRQLVIERYADNFSIS